MFKLDGSPLPSFLPTVGPHLHYLARSDRPGNSLSWAGGLLGVLPKQRAFGMLEVVRDGERVEVKGPCLETLEAYVKF